MQRVPPGADLPGRPEHLRPVRALLLTPDGAAHAHATQAGVLDTEEFHKNLCSWTRSHGFIFKKKNLSFAAMKL